MKPSFPYEPTVDQVTAAEDIKQDMQKRRPMDRLLCGDVGYGKTEMAMRDGIQSDGVWQAGGGARAHDGAFGTALTDRSRPAWRTTRLWWKPLAGCDRPSEQKDTLKTIGIAGEVDLLIGTHRLISKDVKFSRIWVWL